MPSREALIQHCRLLDKVGKTSEAIQLLSSALSEMPNPTLLYERGFLFENLGDCKAALADYTDAIRIESSTKLLIARGRLLCDRLGDAHRGLKDLQSALVLSPEDSSVHNHLCLCFLLLGRKEDALEHAKVLLRLEPSASSTHFHLGQCLYSSDRFNAAARELRIAVSMDAASPNSWRLLGMTLRQIEKSDEAIECFRKSIELENAACTWISLGCSLLETGKFADAIEALEVAKSLDLSESDKLVVERYLELAGQANR